MALAVHLTNHSLPGARLMYIKDNSSNINYLIDSGAALSIIPHRFLLPPSGPAAVNANDGLIPS
jgi:predicted metallo-beta-lactamase superfamily hydrolase